MDPSASRGVNMRTSTNAGAQQAIATTNQEGIIDGQIVVMEVVTEVRVTVLEEFVIEHGTPVPVMTLGTPATLKGSEHTGTLSTSTLSNSSGDNNVLIYLGGQGQPSPTQSLLLGKEASAVGVTSAVVAEIVVPLCVVFFCFGLLIAWRVVKNSHKRRGDSNQGSDDDEIDGNDGRRDVEAGSASRIPGSGWWMVSRQKRKPQAPATTSSSSDSASISSSRSSSSSPPHDPTDPDPLLELGLAYPPLNMETPSDPFAPTFSASAGHNFGSSFPVVASAPPAEKFAPEINPSSMPFLIATDVEKSSLPISPSSSNSELYPHGTSYSSSLRDGFNRSIPGEEPNQHTAIMMSHLHQHTRSAADTILLLESLDAPPPAYTETTSATVISRHEHTDRRETCAEFQGNNRSTYRMPSAPPLSALGMGPEHGSHTGAVSVTNSSIQNQAPSSRSSARRRSWSADASQAWIV
ncbi:hypothetical protein BJ741DRAFT_628996 [Chytriomyces cf. hyalinus JEL632]|nr:hypothetical protein BJ741DRAFT_628996 [Chytriomyces cf. hyalinus JEL632]